MDSILYAKVQKDIKSFDDSHPSTTDFYRSYTKSLMEQLIVEIIDGEDQRVKIPVMYANPERAIAKVKEDRNLKLPLISVAIGDIEENVKARRPDLQLTHYKFFDVEKQRAYRVIKKASKAVVLQFQLTFWTKYTEDMNQMVEAVQMLFQPSLALPTPHEKENKAFLLDILDMSSVQAGDKQDRTLRKRATIRVEAYIPGREYLYSNTGRIKEFIKSTVEF
tara:strand:+ start:1770 stop:2432 length:663 start_codon:yes stop_codon:yes gene_type:complete